jgi:hypothetical protein
MFDDLPHTHVYARHKLLWLALILESEEACSNHICHKSTTALWLWELAGRSTWTPRTQPQRTLPP